MSRHRLQKHVRQVLARARQEAKAFGIAVSVALGKHPKLILQLGRKRICLGLPRSTGNIEESIRSGIAAVRRAIRGLVPA
ncbi:hypothetical protein SAMN05216548_10718 [Faunimonas pinastri]|uniref:Uncharacterized protein n=1 Tax=Faunimonas pinastri TaxID=1855383 RepID=A0A1H9I8L1_9HYPH|nr:hypothetical protein [Faunimonas pinastri]SEQ70897.1 hypothetical protein SAMN05216548_10718 [Faunimonas pinastri]